MVRRDVTAAELGGVGGGGTRLILRGTRLKKSAGGVECSFFSRKEMLIVTFILHPQIWEK